MRLLHTSDWHLGRSFHGVDLVAAQAAMVDGLVDVVRSERVDAVLVSGDLYDRALPPVDAVELWGQTLERLTDAGAAVVVISGNHDSARRLGGGARLLERARVHIRSDVTRCADPVMLEDEYGEVAIYPVPYLEPDVVRPLLSAAGGPPDPALRTHAGVLRAAVDRCRDDLAGKARLGLRSVVMAHAFVAGGAPSASERELVVGGAGQVPPSSLAGFDYVALGHLHGPQVIGDGSVRYAGSPLAYSFSEDRHRKGAWLVELGAQGLAAVEAVPTVTPRALVRVRGTMIELTTAAAFDGAEQAFVSATVTDTACPVGAMAQLQRRFPFAVELSWQPEGGLADLGGTYSSRVAVTDDLSVVESFVRHVRNAEPSDSERAALGEAIDQATRRRVEV
ncbi:MAG: repair protein SbcD/Mre11 [Frankiales bacterium]|nr:repair protein SbcD/Mre11 [Frankiales bacterium]